MLTKDQILSNSDLKVSEVAVPEWGGSVFVRSMTGKERDVIDSFLTTSGSDSGYPGFRAKLCVLTICDESGAPVFKPEDEHLLAKKSAVVLQRIFDASLKVNGMSKEAADGLKDQFPQK